MAGAGNPYDLADRKGGKGPDKPAKTITYTEDEQRAKLEGYMSISPDLWPFVRYATHVRYIETAERGGEFRSGGFILLNPFDTKVRGTQTEKRFMKLQNGFVKTARDYKEWIVAYEDIEYLYAKGDAVTLTVQRDLQTAVTTLSDNIKSLAAHAKKLERQIAQLKG